MMHGTLARVMLNPTYLIDRFLDQLEKLGALLVLPTRGVGPSCSEAPYAPRLEERVGA
jgi:hypothetical protein